jgi:hypothetical protein
LNLPLNEHQAAALYDILNVYFNLIHDELEKTDDRTHAFGLLESRREETEDLTREFEAMIQRRNVE